MFEELDDPTPVAPEPSHRTEVARRAGRIAAVRRTRRQRVAVAGSVVVVLAAVVSFIGVGSIGSHPSKAAAPPSGPRNGQLQRPAAAGGDEPQGSARSAGGQASTAFGPATSAPSAQGNAGMPGAGAAGTAGCPGATDQPGFVNGTYCGPSTRRGHGDGPGGECTGAERMAPCGPNVVVGHFYPTTLPTGCSRPIVFDGRRWWPDYAVPGASGTTADAWLRLDRDGSVQVVASFGAFGLTPVTSGSRSTCTAALPNQSTSTRSDP